MDFKVEIISIGDELCYGKVQDINSFWLADQITKIGGDIQRITCIKDDLNVLYDAFKESLKRKPKIIISTGGLGPTLDDRTLEALAKLSKKKIVICEDALISISKKRNISLNEMPEFFKKMSRIIEGSQYILNPIGIAPTTILKIDKTFIIAMPGPPKEVKSIFTNKLIKIIKEETLSRSLSKRIFVNMRESEVSPLIEEIRGASFGAYLKPLVSEYNPKRGLPVEVIIFDKSEERCKIRMNEILILFKNLVSKKGREISI